MFSHKETFGKSERLCSKKALAELFESGNSFFCFPFQVIWIKSPSEILSPAQVAFSVSKRCFKQAVKRNLIKRRIKEAYRKNKQILYDCLISGNLKIIFIIIFKDKELTRYSILEKSVKQTIDTLINKIIEYREKF